MAKPGLITMSVQLGVARTVSVEVIEERDAGTAYDFEIDEVRFGVNGGRGTGGGTPTPTPTPTPQPRSPTLTIATSGEGGTRSVTVTATNAQGTTVPGLAVTLSGTALTASQSVVSGTPATITLPTTPGTYTLQAVAANYLVGTASVTVADVTPGTLSIALVGTPGERAADHCGNRPQRSRCGTKRNCECDAQRCWGIQNRRDHNWVGAGDHCVTDPQPAR